MKNENLKIALITPEIFPLAKTGGLADVCSALAKNLALLGHQVKVILPKYKNLDEGLYNLTSVNSPPLKIALGSVAETIQVKSCQLPDSSVECFLISCDKYFAREGMYQDPGTGLDYPDNDERFILFSRAALEVLKAVGFQPDVINPHEYQSALVPAFLKTIYQKDSFFRPAVSVFTIQNIAYQGNYPKESFAKLGLPAELASEKTKFEHKGKLCFLKAGILYADALTTVSETYAVEIQSTHDFGYGLEDVIRQRNLDLYGILNGVDETEWSPETDPLIPSNFTKDDLSGKKKNKQSLWEKCGFVPVNLEIPVLGIISRLVAQKGLDFLEEIAEDLFTMDVKLVLLGTGDKKFEKALTDLEKKYSKKFKCFFTFDDKLAHLIEAGSDIYLMPSRYEPCGLNQMYSLKYGTVPVVRYTGGLADTIENFDPKKNTGTGFGFMHYDPLEFLEAVRWGVETYKNKKVWEGLMRRGMEKDFSWKKAAEKYVEVFRLARK
ncbi:MAG TPA: glycogen synthase GlgA [candidate division Zixibacteria bacterium]|nr:glycogen synthase GlgA [candidate division Zixibacteria bacterium]